MLIGPIPASDAVAEHYSRIRRIAWRIIRHDLHADYRDIDDLAQSAYIECLARINSFDASKTAFNKWIVQTSYFVVRTIRKAEFRQNQQMSNNAVLRELIAQSGDRSQARAIKAAWQALSAAHKATIRKAFAGKLAKDGPSRKRLCKAREKFAALLKQ